MSDSLSVAGVSALDAMKQVGSKYAFYYDTIVSFAIPALITNLVNDANNTRGTFFYWFLISFAGYSAAALVLLLGRLLFVKRTGNQFGIVLATFFVAGVARGLVIYSLGTAFGVVSPVELSFRLVGSVVYTMFILSMITVLVSNAVRSADGMNELEHRIATLQDALINLREKLTAQKAELAGQVKALIYPMVEELIAKVTATRNSGSVADAVDSLKHAVDQQIRPLSQSIGQYPNRALFEIGGLPKDKFRLFTKLEQRIEVATLYTPVWLTLFLVLVSGPMSFHIFGLERGFVQTSIVGILSLAGLMLIKSVCANLKLRQEATFALMMVSYLVLGFAIDLVITFDSFNNVHYLPGRITTLIVVVGLGYFVGAIYQLQREAAASELVAINDHLEKLNAAARRELWLHRRKIATVLHGPVQSHLYASAIRLSQAKRITRPLVDKVSTELRDSLSELDFENRDREPMRLVIRQIIDVWHGTCEIYPNIDKSVYVAALKDGEFEAALIEVVREAISNAVKHSGASEIEIEAKTSGDLVLLSIINNGKHPNIADAKPGFGSKLLDELTLKWSLSATSDDRTKFYAELVLR